MEGGKPPRDCKQSLRPYGVQKTHCRGDHWSPAFICRDFFVFSGRRRRRPLQDLVFFVGTDVPGGPFCIQTTLLADGVSVTPDFLREPKRGFTSRRLSIRELTTYFYRPFVREFLKGVWGKLLARSFPHKNLI